MRLAIVSAALVVAWAVPASARPFAADHVRVELIAEDNAFVPGRRAWLGLRFVHEPHWHTYWINPGDSGLPTKLQWHLPEGFEAGAIDWPAPQRFEAGGIVNFGYDGRALLLVPVDVPASARLGATAHVAVDAKWLVCREECIPGKVTLKLALPVAKSAHAFARWQRAFAAARARKPPCIRPEPHDVEGTRVLCYPGDPWHPEGEQALPGPTRLCWRNGRFEPDAGLAIHLGE